MTAEERDLELKDEKLKLDRDATVKEKPLTRTEKLDKVMKKLEYHESKAEYYRKEMRKLVYNG